MMHLPHCYYYIHGRYQINNIRLDAEFPSAGRGSFRVATHPLKSSLATLPMGPSIYSDERSPSAEKRYLMLAPPSDGDRHLASMQLIFSDGCLRTIFVNHEQV